MPIVGNTPARYGSKRLPGKPPSDTHGTTLIERVHGRSCAARSVDRVMAATDDERIGTADRSFRGMVAPSSPDRPSGGGRPAGVSDALGDAVVVLDAQAEEPGPLHVLHHGPSTPSVASGEGQLAVDTPESLERVCKLLAPGKGRLA